MEDHKKILLNIEHLIRESNLNLLLPKLVEKNLLAPDMMSVYEIPQVDERLRKAGLFYNILHSKTDGAYGYFIQALGETGHNTLVELLTTDGISMAEFSEVLENNQILVEPTVSQSSSGAKHARPFTLPPQESAIIHNANGNAQSLGLPPRFRSKRLNVNVKKSTKLYDDIKESKLPMYHTHSKNRGAMLMINNKEFVNNVEDYRLGSEDDERNLHSLFNQCGFRVQTHQDLSAKEMRDTIHSFSTNEQNLKGVDIVVVAIMSHGRGGNPDKKNSLVVGRDGQVIAVQDIIDMFNNDNCPVLQGIPKIFIFQICRGSNIDFGTAPNRKLRARTVMDSSTPYERARTYSDMLIAQSTLPDYSSHRDVYLGTWYIQSICKVFMEHAHDTHIEDLFKLVDDELTNLRSELGTKQTSSYENLGFKICYLHPGYYP